MGGGGGVWGSSLRSSLSPCHVQSSKGFGQESVSRDYVSREKDPSNRDYNNRNRNSGNYRGKPGGYRGDRRGGPSSHNGSGRSHQWPPKGEIARLSLLAYAHD